jgi:hypothetical protein
MFARNVLSALLAVPIVASSLACCGFVTAPKPAPPAEQQPAIAAQAPPPAAEQPPPAAEQQFPPAAVPVEKPSEGKSPTPLGEKQPTQPAQAKDGNQAPKENPPGEKKEIEAKAAEKKSVPLRTFSPEELSTPAEPWGIGWKSTFATFQGSTLVVVKVLDADSAIVSIGEELFIKGKYTFFNPKTFVLANVDTSKMYDGQKTVFSVAYEHKNVYHIDGTTRVGNTTYLVAKHVGVVAPKQEDKGLAELKAADRLFGEGKRAEAVAKYKTNFAAVASQSQAEILKRIVEHEVETGDLKEARRWIELGLDKGLAPRYAGGAAFKLEREAKHEREFQAFKAKLQDKGVPPAFDPKDPQRSALWLVTECQPLKEADDNLNKLASVTHQNALNAKLAALTGQPIDWVLKGQAIEGIGGGKGGPVQDFYLGLIGPGLSLSNTIYGIDVGRFKLAPAEWMLKHKVGDPIRLQGRIAGAKFVSAPWNRSYSVHLAISDYRLSPTDGVTGEKEAKDNPPPKKAPAAAEADLKGEKEARAKKVLADLKSADADVRRAALLAAGELGELAKDAVAELALGVGDSEKAVRLAALDALRRLGPDSKEAVPHLAKALANKDLATRQEAIRVLAAIGPDAEGASSALVKLLAGKEEWQGALQALVKIGKAAVPSLVKGLESTSPLIRQRSARGLGEIGPDAREALPVLTERARTDPSVSVREEAQEAIGMIKK